MFTFGEAVAVLAGRHPDAEHGVSVTDPANQYFGRGQDRTYRRVPDSNVFVSTDDRKRMYVYFSDGGIFAGDKDWPEYANR